MGADHDVHQAVGKALLGAGGVLGADETGKLLHHHRQAPEAVGEGAVMLTGQEGCRHHHRHLLAGEGCNEGRAQRHLGLAEANVAAHQPVHRAARPHILGDVGDGGELVVGLGVGEAGGELGVETFGGGQRLALAQFALGGDAQEGVGHVLEAFLDPRLAALPGGPAELVELSAGLLGAVARQHLDVLDRNEQLLVAVVDDAQAVVRRAGGGDGFEAIEAADAVVHVDDEIAGRKAGGLGDEVGGAPLLLGRPGQTVAKNVLLGDDGEIAGDEAVLDAEHDHGESAAGKDLSVGPGLRRFQPLDAVVGQHRHQAVARAGTVAGHHYPPTGRGQLDDMFMHRVEDVEVGSGAGLGEILAAASARIHLALEAGRHRKGRELGNGVAAEDQLPAGLVEVEPVGGQRLVGSGAGGALGLTQALAGIEKVGHLGEAGVPRLLGLVIETDDRVGQIVREGLEAAVEQRQPVLHAGMAAAGAHRFIERVLVGDGAEEFAVAGAEAGDRGLVEEDLGHGLEIDPVALVGGSLAEGIEGAHAVQFVAEEVESQGLLGAGREEVDDAAADGVLAGLAHGLGAGIAVVGEVFLEAVEIDALADGSLEAGRSQCRPRRQLLHHRRYGGEDEAR